VRRLLRAKDQMDAASHEDGPPAAGSRERCPRPTSRDRSRRPSGPAAPVPAHAVESSGPRRCSANGPVYHPRSRSRLAGRAWERSGARSATSPARARVSSGRPIRPLPHELEWVPPAFVSAARRPDLTIAVSEKRRQRWRYDPVRQHGGHMNQGVEESVLRSRSGEALSSMSRNRIPRPHRRAERRLTAGSPVQHPEQPSSSWACSRRSHVARRGDREDLARDRGEGCHAAARARRRRCRDAYDQMLARGVEFTQKPWIATAAWTPASAILGNGWKMIEARRSN